MRDVQKFNARFGLPLGTVDLLSDSKEVQDYRIKFMQEELDEFYQAVSKGDRVAAFDALLDLVYVAEGTALFMGVNPEQWEAGRQIVHDCNMEKVPVARIGDSKRVSLYDVIKPEGWVGPEDALKEVLSWEK